MERRTAKSSSSADAAGGPDAVDLPKTMRALGARQHTQVSGLEVLEVPVPDIKEPKQMLIKMHAAGFATGDANIIAGKMKMLVGNKPQYVHSLTIPVWALTDLVIIMISGSPFGLVLFVRDAVDPRLHLGDGPAARRRGVIMAIAALFPAELFREVLGDVVPFWFLWLTSLAQLYYRWLLRGTDIKWGVISGNAGKREDVGRVGEILATDKIQPVMTVVEMEDIEAVRKAADKVQKIKGGVGGLVINIV